MTRGLLRLLCKRTRGILLSVSPMCSEYRLVPCSAFTGSLGTQTQVPVLAWQALYQRGHRPISQGYFQTLLFTTQQPWSPLPRKTLSLKCSPETLSTHKVKLILLCASTEISISMASGKEDVYTLVDDVTAETLQPPSCYQRMPATVCMHYVWWLRDGEEWDPGVTVWSGT